jgi:molecular chaperone GrpE
MSKKKQEDVDYKQAAEQLAAENAQVQQQVAELTEALQRERADAVNLRRRHDEQVASLRSTVKASVVTDLLPIIDNFERAIKHLGAVESQGATHSSQQLRTAGESRSQGEKHLLEWVDGVQKIIVQFEKTLADLGVERIKTVGEPFDPHYHEAVSMEEGEGEHEVVSEELQSGYRLGDTVIRPAMVRVKSQ